MSTIKKFWKCLNPERQLEEPPKAKLWNLIYKMGIMICFFAIIAHTTQLFSNNYLSRKTYTAYWFIYFSHWILVSATISAVLGFFITMYIYCRQENLKDRSVEERYFVVPYNLSEVYAEIYIVSLNLSVLISAWYWLLIYPSDDKLVGCRKIIATCLVHGISAIILLIDLFAEQFPIRLLSLFWTLIFYMVYVIFILCYHLVGADERYDSKYDVPYSYKLFNWEKDPNGFMIVIGLVTIVAIQFFIFALYLLRNVFCDTKYVFVHPSSNIVRAN